MFKFVARQLFSSYICVAVTNTDTNEGQAFTVSDDHNNYNQLRQAVRDNDADTFMKLVDVQESIKQSLSKFDEPDARLGAIVVMNGEVYYYDEPIHGSDVNRLLQCLKEDEPLEPMLNYLDKVNENPSSVSRRELYDFSVKEGMPVTEEGDILCYKTVRRYDGIPFTDVNGREVKSGDYVDKYSGKVRNNVGDVIEMERRKVDDDRDRTCSYGYHVGALSYSGPGGWYNNPDDVVLMVTFSPKDAVSVPSDHNGDKLRVCKYKVIGEYKGVPQRAVYHGVEKDYEAFDDYDEQEEWLNVEDLLVGEYYSFEDGGPKLWYGDYVGSTDEKLVFDIDGEGIKSFLIEDVERIAFVD